MRQQERPPRKVSANGDRRPAAYHSRSLGTSVGPLTDPIVSFAVTPIQSDGEPTSDRSAIGVPVVQTVVADIHRDGDDMMSARSMTAQRPMMRKEQVLSDQRHGKKTHSTTVGW